MLTPVINGRQAFAPPPPYRRPAPSPAEIHAQVVTFLRDLAQDPARPKALRIKAASLAEQLEHDSAKGTP